MEQPIRSHSEYVNSNDKNALIKIIAKEILEQLKAPKSNVLKFYEKEFGSDYITLLTKVKLLFADMVFEMLEQEVRSGLQPKDAYKRTIDYFSSLYKFSHFWTEAKNILKAYKI